jgi:hypothetical protein
MAIILMATPLSHFAICSNQLSYSGTRPTDGIRTHNTIVHNEFDLFISRSLHMLFYFKSPRTTIVRSAHIFFWRAESDLNRHFGYN